jgi:hypothetical protein
MTIHPAFHHSYRKIALLVIMLVLLAPAAACQNRGITGSALLTPVSGAASQTATLQPTASDTAVLAQAVSTEPPTEAPEIPSDTPSPEATATPSSIPTDPSTPTLTATWDGTPSRTPTRTLIPTRTYRPTRTPSITPTPTPPLAWVRINRPGPYSKVSSPFHIEAVINPGDDGLVHLEIIGEDGRIVHREDLDFRDFKERHLAIGPDISFDIAAASETARLVLYSTDQFKRTIYLASVDLVLMKVGDDDLTATGSLQEPYIIRSPKEEAVISGGVLQVTGLAHLVNDQPLIIELTDEQGNAVGQAEAQISQPYGDLSHVPFSIFVPYSVSGTTPVRMSLRQESASRIPGTVFLYSILLTLEP